MVQNHLRGDKILQRLNLLLISPVASHLSLFQILWPISSAMTISHLHQKFLSSPHLSNSKRSWLTCRPKLKKKQWNLSIIRLSCPKHRSNLKSLSQKKRIFKTTSLLKQICKLSRKKKKRSKKNNQAKKRRSKLSRSNQMLKAKVILKILPLLLSALTLTSKQSSRKNLSGWELYSNRKK